LSASRSTVGTAAFLRKDCRVAAGSTVQCEAIPPGDQMREHVASRPEIEEALR
jgi:hypothetical protein